MQAELLTENSGTAIRILGVNETGHEAGNGTITSGRTIPWLQDTPAVNAWALWAVTKDDVQILDRQNRLAAIYSLAVNNLADPLKYAELKALLKQVAGE